MTFHFCCIRIAGSIIIYTGWDIHRILRGQRRQLTLKSLLLLLEFFLELLYGLFVVMLHVVLLVNVLYGFS